MLNEFLKKNITSQSSYVEYGYGQVEPNHLSAQRTAQIYAQLPAAADIDVLEQGQFVKYDYAKNVVNFEGAGEWMLVYNEIKLYREHQIDCEFAMIKDNYQARVYSPYDYERPEKDYQTRFYNGVKDEIFPGEDVTAAPDMYELHYNEDPFHTLGVYKERLMPVDTTMVPRVFKTNVGDIFTTNTVNAETLVVGDVLTPGAKGILEVGEGDMKWQVVRVYTMPDGQKGVKIMRIA
jgi:hypothetical protein